MKMNEIMFSLMQAMRLAKRQEINVFAVVLHSHLLGKGLTVRHLRYITQYLSCKVEIIKSTSANVDKSPALLVSI